MKVSPELMAQCLHLPEGTQILGAKKDAFDFAIELVVEHPDIKEVTEGNELPYCRPKFRTQESVAFEGWGQ